MCVCVCGQYHLELYGNRVWLSYLFVVYGIVILHFPFHTVPIVLFVVNRRWALHFAFSFAHSLLGFGFHRLHGLHDNASNTARSQEDIHAHVNFCGIPVSHVTYGYSDVSKQFTHLKMVMCSFHPVTCVLADNVLYCLWGAFSWCFDQIWSVFYVALQGFSHKAQATFNMPCFYHWEKGTQDNLHPTDSIHAF